MEWQLRWGKDESFLRELEDDGRMVKALVDKPALNSLQSAAMDLFWLLSAGRPIGMGPGPIPSADIMLVGEAHGFPLPWFFRMIRTLDHEFLEDMIEKRKSKEKKQPPKKARRS